MKRLKPVQRRRLKPMDEARIEGEIDWVKVERMAASVSTIAAGLKSAVKLKDKAVLGNSTRRLLSDVSFFLNALGMSDAGRMVFQARKLKSVRDLK